jgi:DNA polymerase III, delta'' subunit
MIVFKDILGNEHVKEYFIKAIQNKNIAHAYILTGEMGLGKKTTAKIFAMTLLCESGETTACGECTSCKQFLSDNHPDIKYVKPKKSESIGVDDIREQINDDIIIKPYKSNYKIYIVDEAAKMTEQAQNALLKTIEEPPAYAIILLLTDNASGFLETVLSRCITIELKPLHDDVVKQYLIANYNIIDKRCDVAVAFARGNIGKAVYYALSEDFEALMEMCLNVLKYTRDMDVAELLNNIKVITEKKININMFLEFIMIWYRDVLMYKVTKDINQLIFKDNYSLIAEAAKISSFEGLERIIEAIYKANTRLKANVNFELAIELMLLTIKEN